MKQTRLGLPFKAVFGEEPAGSTEPLFWFKTFRILRAFSPAREHLIREIKFHRGLNIVWSKPPAGETTNAKERTAGHAGGKTTLCCLLRGLLGEPGYESPTFLQSVKEHCPDGWFAAELRLNGTSWCVARPFSSKAVIAAKMDKLDDFLAAKPATLRDEFDRELSKAASLVTPIRELPGGAALQPWGFFPWFVRDQNAQFSSAGAWTDSSTGRSPVQSLTPQDRSLVMRSVFDPYAAEEVPLMEKLDEAKKSSKQRKKKRAEKLVSLRELGGWLAEQSELKDLENDQSLMRLDGVRKQLDAKIDELSSSSFADSEAALAYDAALVEWNECQKQAEAASVNQIRCYEENKAALPEVAPPEPLPPVEEEYLMRLVRSRPSRLFCCVPMSEARKHCVLARVAEAASGALERSDPAGALVPARQLYAQASAMADRTKSDLAKAKVKLDEAKRIRDEELRKLESKKQELGNQLDNLNLMERLGEVAESEKREADKLSAEVKDLAKKIDEARNRSDEATALFHHYFGDTLRFVYGESATGSLSAPKGVIHLQATVDDSDRKGAALNAATVVCFDLALLAEATDGKCSHPRFLVHDGPRVADVTVDIYHRYFDFVEMLASRSDSPNFQYIITTTTPPPERFQGSDSVVCELDASTDAGRLLGVDLT